MVAADDGGESGTDRRRGEYNRRHRRRRVAAPPAARRAATTAADMAPTAALHHFTGQMLVKNIIAKITEKKILSNKLSALRCCSSVVYYEVEERCSLVYVPCRCDESKFK